MKNETRKLFNAYAGQIAQLNGVEDATTKFSVTPSIQQKLETKIQESSEFLSKINIIGVTEQQGEKLGLGVGGPIASNTNTTANDRQTKDPHNIDAKGYHCRQNNSDTHIRYATIDMWAKFPDFQMRLRDAILRRQALDRLTVAFNGTSYAADSDLGSNPLLQDVNIGWLERYRQDAAARVMSEVAAASGVINIGSGVAVNAGYKNLDALVMDAVSNLIEPWYRADTQLVAVMGRGLLDDKYFPLVNQNQPSSEVMATDMIISQKRVGGLSAVTAPFVPDGTILITRLDNLSMYYQEGTKRRQILDNAKRDRIENYESSNDWYGVEDYGAGCLLENITLV